MHVELLVQATLFELWLPSPPAMHDRSKMMLRNHHYYKTAIAKTSLFDLPHAGKRNQIKLL
jgi:hypothetical protein